jgi:hypothetical protein
MNLDVPGLGKERNAGVAKKGAGGAPGSAIDIAAAPKAFGFVASRRHRYSARRQKAALSSGEVSNQPLALA